ncbi:MAG: SRPBCC family protein [Deltaproteobacteria bacterium]|nr:SRPBCC family protein [Deltaproteobacteria bacterium]
MVLRATPAEVFAVLSDPLRWPSVLSDVERIEEEGRGRKGRAPGQSWRVHSRLLGHCHVLELRREVPSLVHFHVTDAGPGGVLEVDLRLLPSTVDGGPATRVEYTMHTRLPLGLDAVIDEDLVRRARERKVLSDLTDLEARFGGAARPP